MTFDRNRTLTDRRDEIDKKLSDDAYEDETPKPAPVILTDRQRWIEFNKRKVGFR